jgi:G3E family GTPase
MHENTAQQTKSTPTQPHSTPIPVTVLSGYLGSGKTTLLNDILQNQHGYKVAVIVNDMSEVNVDATLVEQGGHVSRTEETLVEMSNGCICCTLREDLLKEVQALATDGRFDYILIESTGISEPIPIAQTFSYADEETGIDLSPYARLDTMVTVVDAFRFWKDFSCGESLLDRKQAAGEEDTREVVDLLIDQIEFCNVLILNKCDLVEEQHVEQLEGLLRTLQPSAHIIRTEHGKVQPATILNTRLFDFETASQSAGWLQVLNQPHHTPETEEYGISTFVFRSRRPFHPNRFAQFLYGWPEEVVRAKGVIWIATRNAWAGMLSQAGHSIQLGTSGQWLATMPLEERETLRQEQPEAFDTWQEPYGDRQTELVIIGVKMDRAQVYARLEEALLTEQEMQSDWHAFVDPLPAWVQQEEPVF